MHEGDRQHLKECIIIVIKHDGQGKANRKKFKKQVAKQIKRSSAANLIQTNMMIESAMELVKELWAEVIREKANGQGK